MTPLLEKWDLYKHGSNLLAVIREINSRFDADPPIPEKLVEQMNQGNDNLPLQKKQTVVIKQEQVSEDEEMEEPQSKSAEIKQELEKLELESKTFTSDIKEQLKVLQ